MFTGIVTAIGAIEVIEAMGTPTGVVLTIAARAMPLDDVAIGDSIAINGACMTVVGTTPTHFRVEVSEESLSKTVGLDRPGDVNLEKSLRMSDFLGGHLVSGHIDGVGIVVSFQPVGTSTELVVRVSNSIGRYLAYKGSVAVNGVSLTVNRVSDADRMSEFSVNLISHTLAVTTLGTLRPEQRVNLEVDMMARYAERILATRSESR